MTEQENKLLKDFFQEASRQEIADNGFTERVMQHLPQGERRSVRWLERLWTLFCIAVAVVLFISLDGMATVRNGLEVFLVTFLAGDVTLTPVMMLLGLAFVVFFLPYQTARKLSAIQ